MDTGQKRSRFENETSGDFKRPRYNTGYEQQQPQQQQGKTEQASGGNSPSGGNRNPMPTERVGFNNLVPSKVLHVRNLPPDVVEQDLLSLASRFGRVENVLILKGKNQGFVEMADIESATTLFNFHNTTPANIRGRSVYFQFSNRDEITSPHASQTDSNSILLVTVYNCYFPITIDVLHQVFAKYGRILKIVIFPSKNPSVIPAESTMQSLIQFGSVRDAVGAKVGLDGQNIYNGCCTLHIQFSSLTNLNVRQNNQKGRDFTQPYSSSPSPYPSTPYSSDPSMWTPNYMHPGSHPSSGYPTSGYPSNPYAMNPGGAPPNPMAMNISGPPMGQGSSSPTVLIVSNLDSRVDPDALFTLFGVYGDVLRVKILYNKPDTALIQFVSPQHCIVAHEHLANAPLFGKNISVNFSKHTSVALPRPGSTEQGGQESQENKLTKDYSGSPLHRFRVANSKNYQHICPPSQVVHVSNISPNGSEQDLRDLFSKYGNVLAVKFFPGKPDQKDIKGKESKMALVEMSTLEEAITALIYCHNFKLGDGPTNIRVSFTQRKITNTLGKRRERSTEEPDGLEGPTSTSQPSVISPSDPTTTEGEIQPIQ